MLWTPALAKATVLRLAVIFVTLWSIYTSLTSTEFYENTGDASVENTANASKPTRTLIRSLANASHLTLTRSVRNNASQPSKKQLSQNQPQNNSTATTQDSPTGNPNPCESPEALQQLLDQETTAKYSQANPVCPQAAYNHMHVVIPFYSSNASDNKPTIHKAIESVLSQDYPPSHVTIWVYDDASNNQILTLTQACGGSQNILSFSPPMDATDKELQEVHQQTQHNIQHLQQRQSNTTGHTLFCFQSTRHLGPAGSKFWIFQLLQTVASPNDVVLVLDGDDEFLHNQALQTVNQKYIDQAAWFTYGSMEGMWSEQIQDLPAPIRQHQKLFQPRQNPWLYGHPRTFKAHLVQHLTPQDFQYKDGTWLVKGTERGFVYRMMELAGPDRIGYIPRKIYKYHYNNATATAATLARELQTAQIQHSSLGMPPSTELQLPLHVVLLVWKRLSMLPDQLTWMQAQVDLDDRRPIHLHLVNNNLHNQTALDHLVKRFLERQAIAISKGNTPISITVHHRNEGGPLHHNFARFVYVQKLRSSIPLDHVIFVDDDQYWHPKFFSSLLKAHKPKSMTTWYGKTYKKKQQGSTELAQYWYPSLTVEDIQHGNQWPAISYYKYGGAGGAIYDANLWLLDQHLQRPARDITKWAKIDDLWASYVLDALLGWQIQRSDPKYIPVDIGNFQVTHRANNTRHWDPAIPQMLRKKFLGPTSAVNANEAATFLDPTVDKQAMFDELQVTFRWDAFSLPKHDAHPPKVRRVSGHGAVLRKGIPKL